MPQNCQYLLLGSFVGRQKYEWFYDNGRNQFWGILEAVYGLKLETKEKQQALCARLGLAVADIILACERKENNNKDNNLVKIVFNTQAITEIIKKKKIRKIFFSSKFAEKLFRKQFKGVMVEYPEIELVTLPSPSPRYARMSRAEKVRKYKELLPDKII